MRHAIAFAAALLLIPVALARADPLDLPASFAQSPWDPLAGGAYSNCLFSNQVAADDFTVAADAPPVLALRWWGGYPSLTGVRPDGLVTFDINFYLAATNIAGNHLPGLRVAEFTVAAAETFAGYRYSQPIYLYEAALPVPFDQAAFAALSAIPGELWLAIDLPLADDYWIWQSCVDPHPRGADIQLLRGDHVTPLGVMLGMDASFDLLVPEPAAMALLGAGLAVMFLARRRPRR